SSPGAGRTGMIPARRNAEKLGACFRPVAPHLSPAETGIDPRRAAPLESARPGAPKPGMAPPHQGEEPHPAPAPADVTRARPRADPPAQPALPRAVGAGGAAGKGAVGAAKSSAGTAPRLGALAQATLFARPLRGPAHDPPRRAVRRPVPAPGGGRPGGPAWEEPHPEPGPRRAAP